MCVCVCVCVFVCRFKRLALPQYNDDSTVHRQVCMRWVYGAKWSGSVSTTGLGCGGVSARARKVLWYSVVWPCMFEHPETRRDGQSSVLYLLRVSAHGHIVIECACPRRHAQTRCLHPLTPRPW